MWEMHVNLFTLCMLLLFSEFMRLPFLAGDIAFMKFLLAKGVDIDLQSDAGTPLIWAAGHGQEDAVRILLQHHANVFILSFSFQYATYILNFTCILFSFWDLRMCNELFC